VDETLYHARITRNSLIREGATDAYGMMRPARPSIAESLASAEPNRIASARGREADCPDADPPEG
jgi:hypothetical protein